MDKKQISTSLDQINLNLFRVFRIVYETRSMTEAAHRLHLTQSGVSQHIQSLEDALEVTLFDRIQKKLVPTEVARNWYEATHESFELWNKAWSQTHDKEGVLRGTVRIGMPVEFGINIVLPKLAEFSKKYPNVNFKIDLDFASVMNGELLEGNLDFAFVDEYKMDSRIEKIQVYDEIHELCTAEEKWAKQKKCDRRFFESLRYVDYQEDSVILSRWFKHHYGFRELDFPIVATVMDVNGVSRLIKGGVGIGILPRHRLERLIESGADIYSFKGSGKPLINQISLAWANGRTQSPASRELIEFFKKAFE